MERRQGKRKERVVICQKAWHTSVKAIFFSRFFYSKTVVRVDLSRCFLLFLSFILCSCQRGVIYHNLETCAECFPPLSGSFPLHSSVLREMERVKHKEGHTKNGSGKVKLFLPSAGNHTDTCRWADPSPEREREIEWDHERSRGHVLSWQMCVKQVCVCMHVMLNMNVSGFESAQAQKSACVQL